MPSTPAERAEAGYAGSTLEMSAAGSSGSSLTAEGSPGGAPRHRRSAGRGRRRPRLCSRRQVRRAGGSARRRVVDRDVLESLAGRRDDRGKARIRRDEVDVGGTHEREAAVVGLHGEVIVVHGVNGHGGAAPQPPGLGRGGIGAEQDVGVLGDEAGKGLEGEDAPGPLLPGLFLSVGFDRVGGDEGGPLAGLDLEPVSALRHDRDPRSLRKRARRRGLAEASFFKSATGIVTIPSISGVSARTGLPRPGRTTTKKRTATIARIPIPANNAISQRGTADRADIEGTSSGALRRRLPGA